MNPLFQAASGGTGAAGGLFGGNMSLILMLVVMGAALYFLMIRPQKKKEKQAQDLRNSIQVGDEVTTIGGIVGRVVSLKEDTFVIETAGDRSRMRFKRWAIQDVNKLNLDAEGDTASAPAAATKTEDSGVGGFFKNFGKKKDGGDSESK